MTHAVQRCEPVQAPKLALQFALAVEDFTRPERIRRAGWRAYRSIRDLLPR